MKLRETGNLHVRPGSLAGQCSVCRFKPDIIFLLIQHEPLSIMDDWKNKSLINSVYMSENLLVMNTISSSGVGSAIESVNRFANDSDSLAFHSALKCLNQSFNRIPV